MEPFLSRSLLSHACSHSLLLPEYLLAGVGGEDSVARDTASFASATNVEDRLVVETLVYEFSA